MVVNLDTAAKCRHLLWSLSSQLNSLPLKWWWTDRVNADYFCWTMLQESSKEVQAIVSLLKPEVFFPFNSRLSCLILISCCFPFFYLYIFNDESIWLAFVCCRLSSLNCAQVVCKCLPVKILRSLLLNLFYNEQGLLCTIWYTLSRANFCGSH